MQELTISRLCLALCQILKWWLPANANERSVLALAFMFYFALSQFLTFSTSLIDAILPGYWGYMGYDNSWYVHYYFGLEYTDGYFLSRHPFLKLFFMPMMVVGYCIQNEFGQSGKLFFYLVFFNLITALSVMLVFRYLASQCEIGFRRSLILTMMFALFFTNILLSFTPESFPVSQLLMLTTISMMSCDLNKQVPFSRLLVLSLLNVGITTTNLVKVVIPYMFTSELLREKLKKIGIVFCILVGLYLVYFALFGFIFLHPAEGQTVYDFILDQYFIYNMNVSPYEYSLLTSDYWNLAFHRFWCGGLLAPKFLVGADPSLPDAPYIPVPQFGGFSWYHSVVGGICLIFFVLGFVRNWRDRRVQILITAMMFDCFLHLVLLFGHAESHIYAAHWIFLVPLAIGFLYRSVKNQNILWFLDCFIILLVILLGVINLHGYYEFFTIANEFFSHGML